MEIVYSGGELTRTSFCMELTGVDKLGMWATMGSVGEREKRE